MHVDVDPDDPNRAVRISTRAIPDYEVPKTDFPEVNQGRRAADKMAIPRNLSVRIKKAIHRIAGKLWSCRSSATLPSVSRERVAGSGTAARLTAKRDVEFLAREVGQWNQLLAGMMGTLKDSAQDAGQSVEAAIFRHPEFEHLEVKGQGEIEALQRDESTG